MELKRRLSAEVCDNLDNDCDGSTDDNLTRGTTRGVGECSGNTGEETCITGIWGGDTCDPLAGAIKWTVEIFDDDPDVIQAKRQEKLEEQQKNNLSGLYGY